MNNSILNFFEDDGKIIPLDALQKKLEIAYNEVANENDNEKESTFDILTDPELQIDREEVVNTFNFVSRSLYLCSEITHDHAVAFSDAIRFWNAIDEADNIPVDERSPIKIYIDSPGGDLDATFSIVDSILLSETPVWTITIGSGDSGGFFVGISGHKKIGYPHSSYLFHEGSCQNEADAHKYFQQVEFYKKKLAMLKKLTLNNTKLTEDEYKKHKKDDLWFTAEEALQKGIIDEIATKLI